MNRQALVVGIAVCLTPSLASAQSSEFTVSVQSAAVRKSPSTGSPLVGHAPRGAVLEVTRDIGAWVKVAWPEAPDGIGYVHQSMGKLAQRATREERLAAAFASLPPPNRSRYPRRPISGGVDRMSTTRSIYFPPPTHIVGLGGQMKRRDARLRVHVPHLVAQAAWRAARPVALDKDQHGSPERVRSTQFAPSVIYSVHDYVSDNVWLRPYFGGGAALPTRN